MTPTDIDSIQARIRAATGPDRELDRAIWDTLVVPLAPGLTSLPTFYDDAPLLGVAVDYTASLDAALALVEKVLPGWSWQVGQFPTVRAQLAEPIITDYGHAIGMRADAPGATPVLALLGALFSAMKEKIDDR